MSYNAQFVSALKEALNGLRTIHSVGEEWCSYIGKIPVGGVPYCGQEVTRSTYSALWQYAQNQGLVKSESEWQSIASAQGGNVPFYSSGDGSSTFRMPRLVGYVRGASSQSESGSYVAEGLPNITGTSSGNQDSRDYLDGAFAVKAIGYMNAGTYAYGMLEDFDASRCSPIYGNSFHVTPETSVVLFGVYAFGEVGNVDALDAGTLASALARVESNLDSKLGADTIRVVETWQSSDGQTRYRKWSDGWAEQSGALTADSWTQAVTFPLEFRDATWDYYAKGVTYTTNVGTPVISIQPNSKTTTGATFEGRWNGGGQDFSIVFPQARWHAEGYVK